MHQSTPSDVIWDITYACPLRCVHCYSESGRRPARQLSLHDMLKVADAIISLGPRAVEFAGGEPLLVKGVHDVAERISRAGIAVNLYTGGWTMTPSAAEEAARVFSRITVSVDGADAATHDRIRGRSGSFDRAMNALALLDEISRRRTARGGDPVRFGIDCVVLRSNFHQVSELCEVAASRFPEIGFVAFGAAVPSGLASRPSFSERELLTDEQLRAFTSTEHRQSLRSMVPASIQVAVNDNFILQMNPAVVERFGFPLMHIEPDGQVRAMPIYEGTVGSLLDEDPEVLWKRAIARWSDPFVVDALSAVRTPADWAEAVRRIDNHFGSDEVRRRIDRRPEYSVSAP
ncbi:radical SAM protein [Microtetraspora sp. AC03309]|uniref:radical SAM protein n=1 Tax=Microtetraspora sp. AC03309 TaxID=2779376 RepID=UPI001E4AE3A2|nr:radical SAM protein [Microtetraspora sp. AC03309]MCC5575314.1 radical SAM protein [Microtetraspora sp. AC03309]